MKSPALWSVPAVELTVDGAGLRRVARGALRTALVRQRACRPALCEVVFADLVLRDAEEAGLRPGASLVLGVGGGSGATLFEGDISTIVECYRGAGSYELRVRAFDKLQRLRQRQPLRVIDDSDCEQLARELVGGDGLGVDAIDGSPSRRYVQYRQTDFDLLDEACGDAGLRFVVADGELLLHAADGDGRRVTVSLGEQVHELRVERSAAPAGGSVVAFGHDSAVAGLREGTADSARSATEPGEDPTAATIWSLTGEAVVTDAEALARARAERDRRAAQATVVHAVLDGDPQLRPGVLLDIEAVPGRSSVSAILTDVEHRLDPDAGYVCEVDSAPPTPPQRRWGPICAFGKVISVADPDRRGRVRVVLPAFGGVEIDWLPTAMPGGGSGKGICALPDVDDTVLVLFPREDLARGVVIGGVYGEEALPDQLSSRPEVRGYALRTRSGHVIHLDDDGDRIRIEDHHGSVLEFTKDRVLLESKADLEIRAPGKKVVIAGSKIDFQQA